MSKCHQWHVFFGCFGFKWLLPFRFIASQMLNMIPFQVNINNNFQIRNATQRNWMKRSFFFHLLHIPFGSEIPEKRLNERKCYYRYFSFAPNPILWRKSLPWCMGLFSNRRRSAAYHHSKLENLMKHLNYTAKSNIFFLRLCIEWLMELVCWNANEWQFFHSYFERHFILLHVSRFNEMRKSTI